ncbi:hypothetical protein CRM22_002701 [Opisthorchis felineus]|uniref:Amiloride-sensitive sodium channel n=1 Tax=Opisthorchis felineus TaxID=147828 RepID=A0A4S2M4T6_OPIFE|nr:hypothetical protein CRM22_002701 [Opisthorchis felineus]
MVLKPVAMENTNEDTNVIPVSPEHTGVGAVTKPIIKHQCSPKSKEMCPSREAFQLFCKCTSVRGMSKLHTGPQFLRCIWLIFVLSMTCLLISATALLIKDFLCYNVSVRTQLRLDDDSPFPSLTVCHQPPFSYRAYELWNRNDILSPAEYNRYMRKLVLDALQKNDIESASSIWGYDTLSVYYQNLDYDKVIQLGHSPSIFLSCMRSFEHTFTFEDNCTILPGYMLRRFSHHQYMNCYTFEPSDMQKAIETSFFTVVVSMGPRDRDVPPQAAFFPDIFEQARGMRIVVHEPGTMPDLERNGIHVEPGKLNEINYEPHRWNVLSTPRRPCIQPNETHHFRDLETMFNYTHEDCLLVQQQLEIINNCHCIYVMYPRLSLPTKSLPYCGQIWPDYNQTAFVERLECLAKYLDISVKRKYDGTKCLPRCNYYVYPSTTSVTKWRGYPWQLYWLRVQNQASESLLKLKEMHPDLNVTAQAEFERWKLYLTYDNLTHIPSHNELTRLGNGSDKYSGMPKWPPEKLDLDGEDFAYIVLRRKSRNTVEENENLVLSLYVLVSRVGGLCSLTIGLTAAFVVELMEFLYLFYVQRNRMKTGKEMHTNLGTTTTTNNNVLENRIVTIPMTQLTYSSENTPQNDEACFKAD